LAEYRIGELADVSGVSVRNIRAYRERGLLDPPRRAGRASFYDEHHRGQLKAIGELLRRGFTSVHIAEFFDGIRRGHDLAELLGLQQAFFGHGPKPTPVAVDVDPNGPEAQRACFVGLAQVVDGQLTLQNSEIATIVAGADDPVGYLRVMLRMHDASNGELDAVAAVAARVFEESIVAHYGPDFVPRAEHMADLLRRVADFRAMAEHVIVERLDAAVKQQLASAVAKYTAAAHAERAAVPKPP
jgi:DNA-binding transcriptional MerR regulator